MKIPKCKTCGNELSLDLNGDYFCLKSVMLEEKHDDNFPSPFIIIKKTDLKKNALKWLKHGFNYALSYIATQEIEGNISYPKNIEEFFNNCYLDVLMKELDIKERNEKLNTIKDKDGNIIPLDNRKYLENPDGTKYKNYNYKKPLKI